MGILDEWHAVIFSLPFYGFAGIQNSKLLSDDLKKSMQRLVQSPLQIPVVESPSLEGQSGHIRRQFALDTDRLSADRVRKRKTAQCSACRDRMLSDPPYRVSPASGWPI